MNSRIYEVYDAKPKIFGFSQKVPENSYVLEIIFYPLFRALQGENSPREHMGSIFNSDDVINNLRYDIYTKKPKYFGFSQKVPEKSNFQKFIFRPSLELFQENIHVTKI